MSRVLLDTSILVYPYDRSEPDKGARARSLLRALHERHEVFLSAQTLAEFYWVCTRKLAARLAPGEAEDLLDDFSQAWTVVPVTGDLVLAAAHAAAEHSLSYWDAQMWAAAQSNDIGVLLTEDLQDGRTVEGVRFRNPLRQGFDVPALA